MVGRRAEAVASSTTYVAWVYLKAIMQAAVEDKRLYRNPCKGNSSIKPPKKPERKARAWEQDRVDAVREALADRYRIMLDLGVGCGLRQGEVFGFSPGDIHGDLVHIERQILMYKSQLYFGPPKGAKERDAPLPKVLGSSRTRNASNRSTSPCRGSTPRNPTSRARTGAR
ncbi:hypothetical protein [Streptomyces sp. NPDC000994]